MSVSKPSICFLKWVISVKWRNKLLIHNINLTGHRKSAESTALDFPGDKSYHSVSTLEVPGFSQGLLPP